MEAPAYNPMTGTTPAAAPAPAAPQLMAVQPAPMAAPAPVMEQGGSTGSSGGGFSGAIRNFFEDINIVDVVTSAFIVGGVLYAVHYFKFMMMMEKTGYADLNSRIQKIEAANTKKAATANATGNRRRPMFGI